MSKLHESCLQAVEQAVEFIENSYPVESCQNKRDISRLTFCQLDKGHESSHRAVMYWE